jgi:histidine ammonia-lyase
MMGKAEFRYGVDDMTIRCALDLVNGARRGILCDQTIRKVEASRLRVKAMVDAGQTVYGINTGFGPLCNTRISAAQTRRLQDNILRSHSVGVGSSLSDTTARLILILKVQALARGYSGISASVLRRILWMIDNGISPVIPGQGSVGASGDLAPLAHAFLPLIGLGMIQYRGKTLPMVDLLRKFKKKPLQLGPKEGLALINGTQFMTAIGIEGLARFKNCLDNADIIGAMTLESLLGSVAPFREELHRLRPHPASCFVARKLEGLLLGSEMVASHTECPRVQDPYSLRCIPQVHGASWEAWRQLKDCLLIEMNSVTDNPVILDDGLAVSGGNFHGQPIALPLDYAMLGASELGNISDRRTYRLLSGGYQGLPRLLMKDTGINSGFMIPQYTSAALVSENKSLCFPGSADSIPTSLGQEDHVSMGPVSARKFTLVLDNLENILAVELLTSAQAFDFRRPMKSSPALEKCHQYIRSRIAHADEDRVFGDDLKTAQDIIINRKLPEYVRGVMEEMKTQFIPGEYRMFEEY